MSTKRPNWVQDFFDKRELFWTEIYPNKSDEEKITFWVKEVHRSMRYQGESDNDPYGAFSKSWLEENKSFEPNFDNIFIKVTSRLGFTFDFDEYQKRILE